MTSLSVRVRRLVLELNRKYSYQPNSQFQVYDRVHLVVCRVLCFLFLYSYDSLLRSLRSWGCVCRWDSREFVGFDEGPSGRSWMECNEIISELNLWCLNRNSENLARPSLTLCNHVARLEHIYPPKSSPWLIALPGIYIRSLINASEIEIEAWIHRIPTQKNCSFVA